MDPLKKADTIRDGKERKCSKKEAGGRNQLLGTLETPDRAVGTNTPLTLSIARPLLHPPIFYSTMPISSKPTLSTLSLFLQDVY